MKNSSLIPNGFLYAYLLFHVLFLQLLSQGSTDFTVQEAKVTQACEAITAAEAAHAAAMLAAEISTWEATAARGRANLCIKDAEDQATLVKRDALERVSRVEAENSAALSYARADAKGLVRKIALLEDELVEERRVWETSEREH
jgi:hypothetical protein